MSLEELGLRRGSRFTYTYDFGDSWVHEIRVEEAQPSRQDSFLPRVIDGARRGPPEDCGGIRGYQELVRAGDIDPTPFDPEAVNRALLRLR